MNRYDTFGRRLFVVGNYIFLALTAILCLLPFINLLATSLSGSTAVAAGDVKFLPIDFNLKSYEFVMKSEQFSRALWVSVERVVLGVSVNMFLTILAAYSLSKEKRNFKWRGMYAWFFFVTILFSGGLIPWYVVISKTGLIDSIWALILPGALPVFNVIVLLNFFRGLPKELEEAAFMDGATHWTVLWRIFVPLSKPALATLALFCIVNHWNSWFEGLILMNRTENYPLQSYLQTIIINPENFISMARGEYSDLLNFVNARTSRAAQLFVGTLPILLVYPFLQKYFTSGLVLGSVKG
ncbi:carbohydrate ABC transporter permease [Paenibacillus radicis (ex Gao et al. 2016)]|uniref:Sugar ABC transporter permease n=1 Tax=Paenibacillus radicis (ex Gao et al. 2016) TaxID=1737354 RepID=A0A917LZ89_9BACL|nr:carbohydrate ABC transporter permease [Paenibacillus radicis (ex Gao et al. 2016)]GGG68709.1 sugar ABC transporter permease [Paenibacillus radicis (ex Gao et al. 2016)]